MLGSLLKVEQLAKKTSLNMPLTPRQNKPIHTEPFDVTRGLTLSFQSGQLADHIEGNENINIQPNHNLFAHMISDGLDVN